MPFIPDSGDPEAAPAPGTVYAVDISSLSDFAGFVRQEFDGQFAPSKQRVELDNRSALLWGSGVPGDLIWGSRTSCAVSHGCMLHNLGSYLRTGTAVVDAIDKLVDTYRTADDLATIDAESMLVDLSVAFGVPSLTAIKADGISEPGTR